MRGGEGEGVGREEGGCGEGGEGGNEGGGGLPKRRKGQYRRQYRDEEKIRNCEGAGGKGEKKRESRGGGQQRRRREEELTMTSTTGSLRKLKLPKLHGPLSTLFPLLLFGGGTLGLIAHTLIEYTANVMAAHTRVINAHPPRERRAEMMKGKARPPIPVPAKTMPEARPRRWCHLESGKSGVATRE